MKAQAVPILRYPTHAFCPHALYSCSCWSSAQERGLRIPPGLLCKFHSQHTGSQSLPGCFIGRKPNPSLFPRILLTLDYTTSAVV